MDRVLPIPSRVLVSDSEGFGGPVRNRGFVQRNFFSIRLVAQNARNNGGVHGVPGAIGFDVAQNALAEQRQVPDQVEHLVAHEFVRVTQRRIVDSIAREHDTVLPRGATDEAHVQHVALLVEKTKGSSGGDLPNVAAVGKFDLEAFAADQWMREVDGVADGIALTRENSNELVALAHFVRSQDLQVHALAPLLAQASNGDHLDERQRAAIENW